MQLIKLKETVFKAFFHLNPDNASMFYTNDFTLVMDNTGVSAEEPLEGHRNELLRYFSETLPEIFGESEDFFPPSEEYLARTSALEDESLTTVTDLSRKGAEIMAWLIGLRFINNVNEPARIEVGTLTCVEAELTPT